MWGRLAPYAVIVALLGAVWFLSDRNTTKDALLAAQAQINQGLVNSLEDLHELHEQHAEQLSTLMNEQRRVAATHANQFAKLTRLQNDVEEIRAWADQPLPGDIVRLRHRGAVTGAAAYGSDLSEGGALPFDRGEPEDERRAEPRPRAGIR
ncbi:MAG: hypothetical protein GX772_06435 [Alcaligenaceae bacterium]|nr:hypothetical protein [Alcaligenaceae bacterium]